MFKYAVRAERQVTLVISAQGVHLNSDAVRRPLFFNIVHLYIYFIHLHYLHFYV